MTNIKAIIWDLDNTLYRFSTLFEDACNHIAGRVVRSLGLDFDDETARIMAEESFKTHGYSMRVFMDEYNLGRDDLHHEFHKHLDETILEKSHNLIGHFQNSDLHHILVTHGSRHWAEKALEHLDLRQFFPDNRLFGLEDYDFKKKDESPYVFEMAMDLVGAKPHETIMAEDTAPNLHHPHELGMKTVLVHHGRIPKDDHPHIHHMVHSAEELFDLITDL